MTAAGGALAVILGRAGSRGLPGKNAMPLRNHAMTRGRPMICYTIDDANRAECISDIVVSTDGDDIAAAARTMDVDVIQRPAELATDDATVSDAVRHAVLTRGGAFPVIVVLYANVPIRPPRLIDRAVRLLQETGADSVQSYQRIGKHHPDWMVTLDDAGRVSPVNPHAKDRRQLLPPRWLPDGGVIAVTRESLLNAGPHPHDFLGRDRRGIETGAGTVVDVDTMLDFIIAEALLQKHESDTAATSGEVCISR